MNARSAFGSGIRRVNRAPAVLFGAVAITLLIALPLSLALRGTIEAHLGRSLVAEAVASGTSYDWWQEFTAQANGLGTTFTASIIGFGAVLENLGALLDNLPMASTIAGVTATWMLVWSFLSGGILDRLARDRRTHAAGFFGACGQYVWRLLRLGALALLVYYVLFAVVHPWLVDGLHARFTRDTTIERTAFFVRAALYLLFVSLLAFVSLVFDYARVRMVVEDRRSSLGALPAALRFILRHSGGTIGLYLLNAAAWAAVVVVYALVARGAPRSGMSMWFVLGLGQLYLVARHYLKLVFYASQTAYFQGALAHAAYTAAPPVVWPDSPAAEAIANG